MTDPSDAVIPRARITLLNAATHIECTLTSGEGGDYLAVNCSGCSTHYAEV